jgi:transposase
VGCPWRDLPERFGNLKTVYNRHRHWSGDGTWAEVLDGLRAGCDEAEGSEWTVSADSTVVRAHQHAAGGALLAATRHPPNRPPGSDSALYGRSKITQALRAYNTRSMGNPR